MKIGVLGCVTAKNKTEAIVKKLLLDLQNCGYETVEFNATNDIDNVDVVLVLGGDGAILHAAVIAAQKGVKIIGINHGNLGFLTEYEKDELEQIKEQVLNVM